MNANDFDILFTIFLALYFLIVWITLKNLFWKLFHRTIYSKHIMADIVFILTTWICVMYMSWVIEVFLFPVPVNTDASDAFFISSTSTGIIIPLLFSYLYAFFYKKYFYQTGRYFALQIFLSYFFLPILIFWCLLILLIRIFLM
mgnify:CR=1 FL=1